MPPRVPNVDRLRAAIRQAIDTLQAALPVANERFPDVPEGVRPIMYYATRLDEIFDEQQCERATPCTGKRLCPTCRAAWYSKQIMRYLETH